MFVRKPLRKRGVRRWVAPGARYALSESFRANDERMPLHSDPGRLSMFRPWLGEVAIAYGLGARRELYGIAETSKVSYADKGSRCTQNTQMVRCGLPSTNTRRPPGLCYTPRHQSVVQPIGSQPSRGQA